MSACLSAKPVTFTVKRRGVEYGITSSKSILCFFKNFVVFCTNWLTLGVTTCAGISSSPISSKNV